jgi:hypothetical protein
MSSVIAWAPGSARAIWVWVSKLKGTGYEGMGGYKSTKYRGTGYGGTRVQGTRVRGVRVQVRKYEWYEGYEYEVRGAGENAKGKGDSPDQRPQMQNQNM